MPRFAFQISLQISLWTAGIRKFAGLEPAQCAIAIQALNDDRARQQMKRTASITVLSRVKGLLPV